MRHPVLCCDWSASDSELDVGASTLTHFEK